MQQGFGPNGMPYGGGGSGLDYPTAGGYDQRQPSMQSSPYGASLSYMQQGYNGPMGPGRPAGVAYNAAGNMPYPSQQPGYVSSFGIITRYFTAYLRYRLLQGSAFYLLLLYLYLNRMRLIMDRPQCRVKAKVNQLPPSPLATWCRPSAQGRPYMVVTLNLTWGPKKAMNCI